MSLFNSWISTCKTVGQSYNDTMLKPTFLFFSGLCSTSKRPHRQSIFCGKVFRGEGEKDENWQSRFGTATSRTETRPENIFNQFWKCKLKYLPSKVLDEWHFSKKCFQNCKKTTGECNIDWLWQLVIEIWYTDWNKKTNGKSLMKFWKLLCKWMVF